MKKFYALIVGLLFSANAALATNLSDQLPTDSTGKEEIASKTSRTPSPRSKIWRTKLILR